jgi:hypothetical protein
LLSRLEGIDEDLSQEKAIIYGKVRNAGEAYIDSGRVIRSAFEKLPKC